MPTDEEQALMVEQGDVLTDVSSAMAQLYTDQLGQVPTRVRSHWAGPDALICILDDTFDAMERHLAQLGDHSRIRDNRQFLQTALTCEFCGPVERITGRTVQGFHSSTDTAVNGQSVEMFVLHPAGYDGPSRIDAARC